MKRLFDLVFSALALLALAPLMLCVAITVRLGLGSPVLFRQQRPGLNGLPFEMFKFRTMTEARDTTGALLPDHVRLTRFGRFLRSTSLDELPGLFNVFRGDMSIVGPRPLMMAYLERYSPTEARRHEVRPGLTGWAQVNGRNTLSWPEKFALDIWYIDHGNFWLDLKIIWMTLWNVLARKGISTEGSATMSEFLGHEDGAQQ